MTQPQPLPPDPEQQQQPESQHEAETVAAIAALLAAAGAAGATYMAGQVAQAGITNALRGLGLSRKQAGRLVELDAARPSPPVIPLQPSTRAVFRDGPTYRAHYLVNAAKRILVAATPGGQTLGDAVDKEQRYFRQHQTAQVVREQAAARIDAAANSYGQLLGWHAVLDDRTTPECRDADGKNFYASRPPAIGLPGLKHAGNCRCYPGPPHDGAQLVDPDTAPPDEIAAARDGGDDTVIDLAATKTTADGKTLYGDGLTYDPKTKSFHPTTDAEKNSAKGGKGGNFNSKHPRAPKGGPGGGRFVPLGTARNSDAATAQKDPKATAAYKALLTAKPDARKKQLAGLKDADLEALTRVLYSFKSSDPSLVAARVAAANELSRRGLDVKKFGALGGPAAKPPVKLASDTQGVELSAKTAFYSEHHHELGTPGGPGLWRHKGWQLPDYITNIAKGVMESGQLDKSRAISIAVGKVRDWAEGKGKVSPEVRAASVKAIAEWDALRARSKATKLASDRGGIELAVPHGTGSSTKLTDQARREMASNGQAMPDGSFPIKSRRDVLNAIHAIGRAAPGRRAAVKAHIIRRAKALGAPRLIPPSWRTQDHTAEPSKEIEMAAAPHRYRHGWIPIAGDGPPKLPAGNEHASRLAVLPTVQARRAHAATLSDKDLRATDQELSRRATALGKPGQVASFHRVVKDEIARRKAKTPGKSTDPAVVKAKLAEIDAKKKSGQMTSTVHAQQRMKLLKELGGAQNAANAAKRKVRLASDRGGIELAMFGGKKPSAKDVKDMVASDAKVPAPLKDAYRKKVVGHARNANAMHHIPPAWLKGKQAPAKGKPAFGGKQAPPFGKKA